MESKQVWRGDTGAAREAGGAMLQADASARRRLLLIVVIFSVLMGSLVITGLVRRFSAWNGWSNKEAEDVTLAETRAEIQRTREARNQLEKLGKERRWQEASSYAESELKSSERPLLRFLYSESQIYTGRFDRAAADFVEALRGGDPNVEAARLAYAGDPNVYRTFCERRLAEVPSGNGDPQWANATAWMCSLMPNALTNYSRPIELAQFAVTAAKDPDDRWMYLNTLGAVQYRAGQYNEAIASLREAEKIHPDPFNWPFLAMSYAKTGEVKQAGYWKNRLRDRLMDTYATNDLAQNRHELLLFYHEAETTVGDPVH